MVQTLIKKLAVVLAVVGLVVETSSAWAKAPPNRLPVREQAWDEPMEEMDQDTAPVLPELAPLRGDDDTVAQQAAATIEQGEPAPLLESEYSDALSGEYIEGEETLGGECGYCGRDDCPTCKHWYSRVDFTLLHRTRARSQTLAQRFSLGTDAQGNQVLVTTPALTTNNDRFNLAPGARITIGRYVGRDQRNRDHMWEASYLGFSHFTSQDRVEALTRVTLSRPNQDVDPVSTATFTAGDLFSRFGNNVRGFSAADAHSFKYVSDLHDFQLTRRIRRGQRREQLVYQPGGWTPMVTPNFVPSLSIGPRFLNINEGFSWTSTGFIDWDFDNAFRGDYRVQTNNHLYGAQVGGDLAYTDREWSVGLGVKFGLFVNFAEQTTEVEIDDPTPFRNQLLPQTSYNNTASVRDLSFVGEWILNYSYHLSPRWMFRFDYGMTWVTGLALAPEQLSFKVGEAPHINNGGLTVFQGGMVGLEFVY